MHTLKEELEEVQDNPLNDSTAQKKMPSSNSTVAVLRYVTVRAEAKSISDVKETKTEYVTFLPQLVPDVLPHDN